MSENTTRTEVRGVGSQGVVYTGCQEQISNPALFKMRHYSSPMSPAAARQVAQRSPGECKSLRNWYEGIRSMQRQSGDTIFGENHEMREAIAEWHVAEPRKGK